MRSRKQVRRQRTRTEVGIIRARGAMLGASKDVSHLRLGFSFVRLPSPHGLGKLLARLRRSVWQAIDQPCRYVKECRWAKLDAGPNRTGARFSPQWTKRAAHRNASYGFNAFRPTRVPHSLRGPAAELRREVVWVGVHAWLRSSRKSWRLAASPQTSR